MRHIRLLLLFLTLLMPITLGVMQDEPAARVEITGVNASDLPLVFVTANVYDTVGQPIFGLTANDFSLTGALADQAQIVRVENVSDENLSFGVVLAIDVSTSMEGLPIDLARQAARAFVEGIGANDPVAIVTFSRDVRVVQPFTTDKNILFAAIDNLRVGGTTALYQGAYDAVRIAAQSPVPRHAMILLSDGGEYGNASRVGRNAAVQESVAQGVPVYSIGLGYGIDRTFLQQLSAATNAQFFETPTSEELVQIYTDLARQFRSQYIITVNAPVPADGTEYELGLQVNTAFGTPSTIATLRAPIPVPIIILPELPGGITEPTDITAEIRADDPIENVTLEIEGTDIAQTLTVEPYSLRVDPLALSPGDYTLNVTATDDNGDIGTGSMQFTVEAVASQIAFSPDPSTLGAITEPQTIALDITGQAVPAEVRVQFDDREPVVLEEPYTFTIEPVAFTPGEHTVTASVTTQNGVESSLSGTFRTAILPPVVSIEGLEEGQTLDRTADVRVEVRSQVPISEVTAFLGGQVLEPLREGAPVYRVDPLTLQPGNTALTVTVTLENGQRATSTVNFVVAPLSPQILVDNLLANETIEDSRDVTITFVSQTPIVRTNILLDGQTVSTATDEPIVVPIDVLALGFGDHVLRIEAENASGQTAVFDVPFTISEAPIATATQVANITATVVQVTQQAQATAAAVQATEFAQSTATAVEATSFAVATVNAQATVVAQETAETIRATATQQAGETQAAIVQATEQRLAQVTSTQAALDMQATQIARSTLDARATEFVQATATQVSAATREAQATQAQATLVAAETVTQESIITATRGAQETATESAGATATERALSTATLQAQLDITEQARATATQQARATETDVAGATATEQAALATAMQGARATETEAAVATATELAALATATQAAQATSTEIAGATATQQAQGTLDALATETQSTRATETAEQQATQIAGQLTATETAARATSTQMAAATATAQATLDAMATQRAQVAATVQAATRDALSTRNAQALLDTQATQDTRATRSAEATATQDALALTATQEQINATATEAARLAQTATQESVDATATANAQQTQDARLTQTAQAEATATEAQQVALAVTETQVVANATETAAAQETATQAAVQAADMTATAEVIRATEQAQMTLDAAATQTEAARASGATATSAGAATQRADILATESMETATAEQVTRNAIDAATANAQATIDTRLTAVGPTSTQEGAGQVAQGATETPTPDVTPSPTSTLVPVQAEEPQASSNVIPLLIVVIVFIIVLLVAFLVFRRR